MMKKAHLLSVLFFAACLGATAFGGDKNEKIYLKVIRNDDESKTTFEETFTRMEGMTNDSIFKSLGFELVIPEQGGLRHSSVTNRTGTHSNNIQVIVAPSGETSQQEGPKLKTDGRNIKVILNGTNIYLEELQDLATPGVARFVQIKNEAPERPKQIQGHIEADVTEIDNGKRVEIPIEEKPSANVHIRDIEHDDARLDRIQYPVKNDLEVVELDYYPNPNNGQFKLTFKLRERKPVQLRVLDVFGKEIHHADIEQFDGNYTHQFDLSRQNNGLYILQISQHNNNFSRKIVIE